MDHIHGNPQDTTQGLFNRPMHLTESEAILYVFSPRRFGDHYKRPIVYNFNQEFLGSMHDTVVDSLREMNPVYGDAKAFNPHLEKLYNNPHSASIIQPSATGIPIGTALFSDAWTFMLVVTNDKPEISNAFAPASANRTVYYGYCSEEPVNMTNMGQGTTVNPGCYLTVTHKTVINHLQTATPGGAMSRFDTVADADVVPVQDMGQVTQAPGLFMNRPGDIRKATVDNGDGTVSVMLGEQNNLRNQTDNVVTSANLNSPKHHCKKILTSVAAGIENAVNDDALGTMAQYPSAMEAFDNIGSQIDSHLEDHTNERVFGFSVEKPFSMSELMNRYNPKIQPVMIEAQNMFDPIPQQEQSKSNIYASMIASAAPTILSNIGIASFAMMYHSPNQATQVLSAEPFIPLTEPELHNRVRILLGQLHSELFDIIRATAGEFDLNMSVSCGGDTHITLNMLDASYQHSDIYQHHNLLGGMTNQLVADFDTIQYNATNLGTMINSMTQTI